MKEVMSYAAREWLKDFSAKCLAAGDYRSACATLVMMSHWLRQKPLPPFESYAAFWVEQGANRNAVHYCATALMQKEFGRALPAKKIADTDYRFSGAKNNRKAGAIDRSDLLFNPLPRRNVYRPTINGKELPFSVESTFFTEEAAAEFARLWFGRISAKEEK